MVGYRIVMTYPNGKVDEMDEIYSTLEEAREQAQHILSQVGFNAGYKNVIDDNFSGKKTIKPYFVIVAKKDGDSMIVYDSRK